MEFKTKDYLVGGFDVVKANLVPSVVLGCLTMVPLISGIFVVNYMAAVKDAKQKGRQIELTDLFNFENAFDKFVISILVGVGLSFFLIPGAIVLFAPCITADRPGPFVNALRGALAYGKSHAVPLIVFTLALAVIVGVASLICVLPVLIAVPTACAAAYVAYDDQRTTVESAAAADGVQL